MGHANTKKFIGYLKFKFCGASCFYGLNLAPLQRFVKKHQQPLVSSSKYTTGVAWVHCSNSTQ